MSLQLRVISWILHIPVSFGEVEGEEVLERLVDLNLLDSLVAVTLGPVEDLHIVHCSDFDAIIRLVLLVEGFFDSSDVILSQSSVLNKLDATVSVKVGDSALGPVVQDCDLLVALGSDISHGDA